MVAVLRDFLFGPRIRDLSAADHEAIIGESDAYGVGESAPLGDWSAVRDASLPSVRVMFRLLSQAVGEPAVNRALRDHMDSAGPAGKIARILKLAKTNAKPYSVDNGVDGGMVIADFHDGRLVIFVRDGFIFEWRRAFTSVPGAFSTLMDVGGWTSMPRSKWPETAHQAYEGIILPRRLGSGFPELAPPLAFDGVTGLAIPMAAGANGRNLPGHADPPRGEQVPALSRFLT